MTAEKRRAVRMGIGVAAVVAIALSADAIWREQRRQEGVRRAQAVVQGQLEAFQSGDYRKAFSFAASRFHTEMSVSQFRQMVEGGYPQVAHPREFHLGRSHWEQGAVLVEVIVTGEDGRTAPHLYVVGHEPDGWRVQAVSGGMPHAPPARKRPRPETPAPGEGRVGAA